MAFLNIDPNMVKAATVQAKPPAKAVQKMLAKIEIVGTLPPTVQIKTPAQPHWGRIALVASGVGGIIGGLAWWFRRLA